MMKYNFDKLFMHLMPVDKYQLPSLYGSYLTVGNKGNEHLWLEFENQFHTVSLDDLEEWINFLQQLKKELHLAMYGDGG